MFKLRCSLEYQTASEREVGLLSLNDPSPTSCSVAKSFPINTQSLTTWLLVVRSVPESSLCVSTQRSTPDAERSIAA